MRTIYLNLFSTRANNSLYRSEIDCDGQKQSNIFIENEWNCIIFPSMLVEGGIKWLFTMMQWREFAVRDLDGYVIVFGGGS